MASVRRGMTVLFRNTLTNSDTFVSCAPGQNVYSFKFFKLSLYQWAVFYGPQPLAKKNKRSNIKFIDELHESLPFINNTLLLVF